MKSFNSHKTYLSAVQEWKAEYKELSQKIREAKLEFKDLDRTMQKAPRSKYGHILGDSVSNLDHKRVEIERMKLQASAMLIDRREAKYLAGEQMQNAAYAKFVSA